MKNFLDKKLPIISAIIVIFLICSLFLPITQNYIKILSVKINMLADVLSSTLVFETNDFRSLNNENSLVESPLLAEAAQMKADDMASKGYFSHIDPNGDNPWIWFEKVGYKYSYAGENLAVNFAESKDVTEAWINSVKHKANLLDKNFTEVGIGIAVGTYEGHKAIYVVQFFGSPYNQAQIESSITKNFVRIALASIKADIAVVTKSGLNDGEVLAAEVSVPTDSNEMKKIFLLVGVSLLLVVMIILKIVSKKIKKTAKNR